ncbi:MULTISPECIES: type II toxin-antitoxin system mRNA interferase toxin, RelE/StbE family [Proteiniphilum]|uniref:type II toxin-antitoxin system mRNA interferase toxin, RelE/StbE family n=1 Tax=Proteiniphilum TaxID=294702 RepID=UPI002110E868|nr:MULTISPECIES: type II toxin-antitoxin system mRNA interferase toxin, RelE/StbE family [Proteiniphilum]ULB34033.1 type II toxin-antitoxin system mRNA interferase toxin, RelE/StbE family [Proteiniphilum propionicum]
MTIEKIVKTKLLPLVGNYKGCWKYHIEGDFLLIWIDENSDVIKLIRLGSHSELFKP